MKKTKWGLIGCGKVVLKNKKTPFINKNNTIVAICTTNIKTAKKAKVQLNLRHCNCYTEAEKMIQNNDIDCIYIATPPKFHYFYLKILSKYNIPIYVEKPFVKTFKEAQKIKKLYRDNLLIFVAHYKRLTKQIEKLEKLIKKGKIGNITSIYGKFERIFNEELYYTSWIYDPNISGGGRFIDIAPHILDILYYLFGEMKIIDSEIEYDKTYNTEKIVKTNIQFNEFNCFLNFNFNSMNDVDQLIINGKKGKIITSVNRDSNIYIEYNNGKTRKINIKKPKIWGIEAVKEINKILNNKKHKKKICSLDEACLIQKYIDLIMKK